LARFWHDKIRFPAFSPVSTPASPSVSPATPVQPRRKRRLLKVVILLVLLISTLLIPPVFRTCVWLVLQEEGVRQGSFVRLGGMRGSVWEPIILERVRWSSEGLRGGALVAEAEWVEVRFKWENLLHRATASRVCDFLEVKGLKFEWTQAGKISERSRSQELLSWKLPFAWPLPNRIIFELTSGLVKSGATQWRFEESSLELSEVAPGELKLGKFGVKAGEWERSFRDLKARTSLQGGRIQLGQLQVMEGVLVDTLLLDLIGEGDGKITAEMHVRAFGGELRVRGAAFPESSEEPLEASGTFSKLGVAPLASFFGVTEAAGGVLEEGKFNFRGSPRALSRGSASLRLEARNFQWESRQWDSLVVGATLMDRRIQVPEFALRQGHNELQLSGDMLLPGGGVSWWKADFGMNVTARIGNLTELSALLLPEFKYTAGALTVDGAVRSQGGVLGGALILTGSKLMWRKAPIEELNAAVKLEGNDIRILSAQLLNRADLVKAKGVVHVGDGWWYDGEFRAAVGNLGNYADLFQPPLAPEPMLGEAHLEWSGKGVSGLHEGRLQGRFEGLRPIKARGSWPHPLRGEFEGKYGKTGVEFETLGIGDDRVSLRGKLVAGLTGARLEGLRFKQGERIAAEGELRIPNAIWAGWPALDWDRIVGPELPVEMRLRLDRLELAELGRLPWIPDGLQGELTGDWETEGVLRDWKGAGRVSLKKGAWLVENQVVSEIGMDLEWKERRLEASRLGWTGLSGRYEGEGFLEWKEGGAEPEWNVHVACAKARWAGLLEGVFGTASALPSNSGAGIAVEGRADFQLKGPLSQWSFGGDVVLGGVDLGVGPDLRWFWAEPASARQLAVPVGPEFLKRAKLQLKLGTGGEGILLSNAAGKVLVDLTVGGTIGGPEIKGEVRMGVQGKVTGVPVEVNPLVLRFSGGNGEPEVEAHAKGNTGTVSFTARALGPLGKVLREYTADGPLSADVIRAVFEEGRGW